MSSNSAGVVISNQLSSENGVLNPQIIGQISSEGSTVSAALIGQHGQQSIINTQQSGLLTTQHIPPLLNNSLVIGQDCNTFIRHPPPTPLPPPPTPNNMKPPALTPIHIPAPSDNHGLHTGTPNKDILPKEEICDVPPRFMDSGTTDSGGVVIADKIETPFANGCRSQVNICDNDILFYDFCLFNMRVVNSALCIFVKQVTL